MKMDWTTSVTVFFSVLQVSLGFNIEPVAWRWFNNPAEGFGHKVIQKRNGLLVSAPLEQYSPHERGQIYECSPVTTACRTIPLTLPDYAVNTSLGLAMAFDPINERSLVCGPTIPKDCKSITMYNGLCLEIDQNNRRRKTTPSSEADCPSQPADIAFLLDGSGSVFDDDFKKMKEFVINVISSFIGKDSRFAIVQFSSGFAVSHNFNTFQLQGDWQSQIRNIRQLGGGTHTATAIIRLVNEVFIPSLGNRQNVNNILIVITDGESRDPFNTLTSARNVANAKNINRFAIGVGNSFRNDKAHKELETIASGNDRVFQVDGFDALEQIRKTLQDKIFSIEGSQTAGATLTTEMSQLGFGAAFFSQGIQMTAVGENQWRGGLRKYSPAGAVLNPNQGYNLKDDSYLGYSIAIANFPSGTFTVVGAPRYQHRGIVMLLYSAYYQKRIDPAEWQLFQSGEYFGAEICTMDVNDDSFTDLLLISAPMHSERDREGRVYVCEVSDWNVDCHFDSPLVLKGASERGRFGSSLAVLPDLNADKLADLAVGAPLENEGQGSIYIFHASGFGQINSTYSQRIPASDVRSGLMYFGMSISQTSFDQSGDGLVDLMVGSKGTVVLLRSKPIVRIDATISFTPQQIPTKNVTCKPLEATAKICFPMSKVTVLDQAQARINYTFTLDARRGVPNNRAFIREKEPDTTGSLSIELHRENCDTINFFIELCPQDALNPLTNELSYSFEGLPSSNNLSPSLSQQSPKAVNKDLEYEIDCGTDGNCTDSLIADFNFTKTSVVQVGIDDVLNVTVSLENTEENSYNTKVLLTYPPGLSYRKFTRLQGRIDCTSLDSEDSSTRGETLCLVDTPIFKSNAKALFVVSYGFNTKSQLDRRIFVTANATSGNPLSSPFSQRFKLREIDVKYSISVTIGSSHSYTNFTSGNTDLQKPVNQSITITNEIRAVNISVVIRVPVKLGDQDIWVDSDNLMIADCSTVQDEEPAMTDFVPQIQENKLVNCSVAKCRVFRCNRFMTQLDRKDYFISANLSSGWIQQIGLESAKFLLISTVSLEYDTDRFIFYRADTNNNPTIRKIEAEVEVYTEVSYIKEIVGGSLGALALVLLLTAALYKAGFFKSKYQEMIADDAQGDAAAPEGAPEDP